jgi:hypothetical protein
VTSWRQDAVPRNREAAARPWIIWATGTCGDQRATSVALQAACDALPNSLRTRSRTTAPGRFRSRCSEAWRSDPHVCAVEAKERHDPHPVRLLGAARNVSADDDRNKLALKRGGHRPRPYHQIQRPREDMTHSPQERSQNRSAETGEPAKGAFCGNARTVMSARSSSETRNGMRDSRPIQRYDHLTVSNRRKRRINC